MKVAFNSRSVYLLGLRLIKRRPEIATELLNECLLLAETPIKDTKLISYYFDSYCQVTGFSKSDFVSSHTSTERRKEFVGVILKIYHPYLFGDSFCYFRPQKGLVINLAKTLNMAPSNTSHMVHEVRKWINLYDDFNKVVTDYHEKMIG